MRGERFERNLEMRRWAASSSLGSNFHQRLDGAFQGYPEEHLYAKVFRQIFESSIAENPELRFTFMDLLVLADSDGVVDMTPESIARITNRPLDIIRATITELESPDRRSRTPDDDGRRLRRLDDHRDWGWVILNYDKFRALASEEQRKERTRLRVRKLREKRLKNENVTLCNASVTPANAGNAIQRESEIQKQMQMEEGKGVRSPSQFAEIPSWEEFWGYVQMHHPTPEWWAKDKFLAADQKNWANTPNWRAYAQRSFSWWNRDGRPMVETRQSVANPGNGTADKILMSKELERVEDKIKEVRNGATVVATGPEYNELERAELKRLKTRRDELKQKLGFQA